MRWYWIVGIVAASLIGLWLVTRLLLVGVLGWAAGKAVAAGALDARELPPGTIGAYRSPAGGMPTYLREAP